MDVLKQFMASMPFGRRAQFQKVRGKSVHPKASGVPKDIEASTPAKRVVCEGVHGMNNGERQMLIDHPNGPVAQMRNAEHEINTGQSTFKQVVENMTSEALDRKWEPLEGNIYKSWAFGLVSLGTVSGFGMVVIFLIQVTAPFAIAYTYYHELGIHSLHQLSLNTPPKWELTKAEGISDKIVSLWKSFLVVCFIICMLLNAIEQNRAEALSWTKSKLFWDALAYKFPDLYSMGAMNGLPGGLELGAVLNCYMLIVVSSVTFILMYFCGNLVDVVMNIMALMFIYRLDDLDSEFVFFGNTDWNQDTMGKIASVVVMVQSDGKYAEGGRAFEDILEEQKRADPHAEFDDVGSYDPYYQELAKQEFGLNNCFIWGQCCCFTLTSIFLWVAIFAFPAIYLGVAGIAAPETAPTIPEHTALVAEVEALKAALTATNAAVATLTAAGR